MLRNSAGGVTRQRYCQPNLPLTLDETTQASEVSVVSLQAAMQFGGVFHLFLHFCAIFCWGWSFSALSLQQKRCCWIISATNEFCKNYKYICKMCRIWKTFPSPHHTKEHTPMQWSSSRLSVCIFALPSSLWDVCGAQPLWKKSGYFHRN